MARSHDQAQQSWFTEETPSATAISTAEAAHRAGLSQRVIQRLVKAGDITGWKDRSGYYRIDAPAFLAWIGQRHQTPPPSTTGRRATDPPAPEAPPLMARLCEQVHSLTREVDTLRKRLARLEEEREIVALVRRQFEVAQEREQVLLQLLAEHRSPGPATPRRSRAQETPTIRSRIHDFLCQEARPRRIWQIAQALHLPASSVRRELARMADHEEISRLKPGLFVSGTPTAPPAPALTEAPTVRPPSLLQRVIELVQEAGRPLRATEIRQGLGMSRSVNQELSTLVQRGALHRKAGLYHLPPMETVHRTGDETAEGHAHKGSCRSG
jgi:excisionase family DNA binding protein